MSPVPLILLALFATGVGQTVVFAVLAPLGRQIGLHEMGVGLIITASSVVFSIASPRWGRFSERAGRRLTMIIGLFGYSFGTALFASAFLAGIEGWLVGTSVLVALVVARMIQSTVMAATSPAVTAYMADITTREERAAGMSRLGAAHNFGTVLGPAIGGGLAMWSLLAPLYLAATVTLLTALVIWWLLPEAPRIERHAETGKPVGFGDARVFPFLVVGISLYVAFSVIQQTLGFCIQDRLHLDGRETARYAGFALMIGAGASLLAQWYALRRDWSAQRLMQAGLPLVLLGAALMVVADTPPLIALAMAAVGAGTGLAGPGYTAAASAAVEAHEQGAVAGLVAAAPSLGYIAGPLLGTGLYHLDARWPYLFVAVSCVPLIVYAARHAAHRPA